MPRPVLKPRRALTRLVLTLIAAVAITGVSACGDDNASSTDNAAGAATQADTQGTTQTQTTPPEDALKDTSTKPVIPKPTGSPPRRLVTEDIVKGRGPAAKAGDTVTVNYVGMNFSNGQEFDSSWDSGGAFPVQLGAGMVVKGWDKGLVGIRKGGRRMLTIPPELGYGAAGYPPDIPPNETLVLVVDAVSVK
jgi:peptidylprolyl isomerase